MELGKGLILKLALKRIQQAFNESEVNCIIITLKTKENVYNYGSRQTRKAFQNRNRNATTLQRL